MLGTELAHGVLEGMCLDLNFVCLNIYSGGVFLADVIIVICSTPLAMMVVMKKTISTMKW